MSRYGEGRRVIGAMSSGEIADALQRTPSAVVLLSRPERLDLSDQDLARSLGEGWRLDERREFRGHRGAMQWLRYLRADDG